MYALAATLPTAFTIPMWPRRQEWLITLTLSSPVSPPRWASRGSPERARGNGRESPGRLGRESGCDCDGIEFGYRLRHRPTARGRRRSRRRDLARGATRESRGGGTGRCWLFGG